MRDIFGPKQGQKECIYKVKKDAYTRPKRVSAYTTYIIQMRNIEVSCTFTLCKSKYRSIWSACSYQKVVSAGEGLEVVVPEEIPEEEGATF